MQRYEEYQEYDQNETPMGLDNVPDQMKPIAYKHSRNQNFDILLSKFFNNGQLTDIELQQLNQHQKIILQEVKKKTQTKTKRPDQYQKLFFKKAFKYAQNAFFKKNKKNRSRRMSQFYHHHFDTVMKALNIPLTNFYHPDKKTKPGLTTGQKSFNSSYVKMILKSQSFRKICIEYHEKFKQDCRQERNKKISTFTGSLFSIMQKSRQDRTKLIRFLQSSKCKIPWCDRDIEEAYKRAGEELDDYSLGDGEESGNVGNKEKRQQLKMTITKNGTYNEQINYQDNHHNENSTLQPLNQTITNYNNEQPINVYNQFFHHHNINNITHLKQQIQLLHYQQQEDSTNKKLNYLTKTTPQKSLQQLLDVDVLSSYQPSQSQSGSVLRYRLDQMRI